LKITIGNLHKLLAHNKKKQYLCTRFITNNQSSTMKKIDYSLRDVFAPKLFQTLKSYNAKRFSQDALAGIIVGIVAIPLAIAFGISSGVGPTEGLVTAIIA
jgi:hypothetical protein